MAASLMTKLKKAYRTQDRHTLTPLAHAPLTQSRETVTLGLEELPDSVAQWQKMVTILLGINPTAL